MVHLLTFTELANNISSLKINSFDLKKCEKEYSENPSKKKIKVFILKYENAPFKIQFKGEVTTNGIAVNVWQDKTTSYSLGVRPTDDGLVTPAVDSLIGYLCSFFPNDSSFNILNFLKDDVIYLKLKPSLDKKSFGIQSNVKLDPKRPAECSFSQGQEVVVTIDLSVYVNMDSEIAGFAVKPSKLEFVE